MEGRGGGGEEERRAKEDKGDFKRFLSTFDSRGEEKRTSRLCETRCIIRGGSDLFFELTLAKKKK